MNTQHERSVTLEYLDLKVNIHSDKVVSIAKSGKVTHRPQKTRGSLLPNFGIFLRRGVIPIWLASLRGSPMGFPAMAHSSTEL